MDAEQILRLVNAVGTLLTGGGVGLLSYLIFFDSKKRSEAAKAKAAELDNINTYAKEWKDLYDQRDKRVDELNAKIDGLYQMIEDDRKRIRELQEKNTQQGLELQKANFLRCEIKGCANRQPPTGY